MLDGHMKNTAADDAVRDAAYGVTAAELRSFVERIEHFDADIKDLQAEKKDVFAELKGRGYDVKAVRKIIALRKQDADQRAEEESVLDLYKSALGM